MIPYQKRYDIIFQSENTFDSYITLLFAVVYDFFLTHRQTLLCVCLSIRNGDMAVLQVLSFSLRKVVTHLGIELL